MLVIDKIPDNKIAISSPVGNSRQFIKKHLVYDCPLSDDAMTWKHRECRFFAPRLKTGGIPKLYEILKVLVIDVDTLDNELMEDHLTIDEINQIKDYIKDIPPIKGGHRFYLLQEVAKLAFADRNRDKIFPKKEDNNTYTCYFDVDDLKGGNEFPENLQPDQFENLGFYPTSLKV